jgi:hypothetical protein
MSEPPSTPPAAPPPPAHHGLIPGILGQVLAYMDRPWKVLAVVGLLLIGALGYLAWLEQPLIEQWWTPEGPASLRSDVAAVLDDLMIQTSADFVSLWAVELGGYNVQRLILSRLRGGGGWIMRPERLPAILSSSDPKRTLTIMNGQPICEPPIGESVLIQRLQADAMAWVCILPVVPAPNQVIGLLYLAWKSRPDPSLQAAYLTFARDSAAHMVQR